MKPSSLLAPFALAAILVASALQAAPSLRGAGPLDLPLPATLNGGGGAAIVEDLRPAPNVVDRKSLVREVGREQRRLGRLGRDSLERLARRGERGAQVALAADYAREAESLAFSPAAANDALSDAVRWYSTAASNGYPGAPSLDWAGIDPYPIRIQRPRP